MASDVYRGLTIEIDGKTDKLTAALSKVNGEVKTANGNIRALDRALKIDPGNMSLLGDKVKEAGAKVDATKERVNSLTQAQQRLAASGDTDSATYQRLGQDIATSQVYLDKYTKELGQARVEYAAQESALGKLGTKLEDVGDRYGAAGTAVSKASGVALGATAAVAAASLAAFESVDTATDEAIRKTGATGAAADALSASVKNVGASASAAKADWSDIGDTVGEVQVKFGLTGDALEGLSEQFLEFGENTGTTAADDVEAVAQAMSIFNVDASQTSNVLGLLQATSQATGASVTDLMGQVQENGATFQSMGLSLGQSVTLLGSFEESGYDSTQMLAALKKAAATYNDEGKDMKTGLADLVTRLQDSSTQAQATSEAYDLFGKRAGTTFVKAAQSGKVNLTDLSGSLSDYASTVSDTFGATEDGVDHAQQALKSLQETGATLGEALSDVMGPTLESASENVKSFANGLDSMSDGEKQGAAQAVIATTAFLGVVTVGGKLVGSLKGIGEGLGTAATFFAKVGGAANVAEEGISASSVAMGVAKTGGIALATIALAAIVAAAVKAKEHEDELTEATKGLASAQSNAAAKANAQSTATDTATTSETGLSAAIKNASDETDAMISAQAKMASTIESTFEAADTSNIKLGTYRDTIDNLANKSGLTAQQQADLKTAVDNLNQSCGTAYTVVDAENGKIADQSGIVQDDTKAIDDLVRAKQVSNQIDALSDAYKQDYDAQATAAKKLTDDKITQAQAQQNYNDALASGMGETESGMGILAGYRGELDKANQTVSDDQAAYESATSSLSSYNDQLNLLTQAQSAGADSVAYAISQNAEFIAQVEGSGKSVSSLASQMSDLGVTSAQMGAILADPTATDQLVSNYDGSETSVATALASMGIDIDAAAAASKASIADMSSSISSLSDSGAVDLSAIGLSAGDLAQALSDAGVTIQAQTALANGNFADMYSSSGGDIDKLIDKLQNYSTTIEILNKTGIDPKTITVNDDGSITTETGAIITLDSLKLGDKTYTVTDDGSITTSSGQLTGFNTQQIATKSYVVTDDGSIQFQNGNVINLDAMTINGKHYTVSDDGTISIEDSDVTGLDLNDIADKDYIVTNNGTADTATQQTDNTADAVRNVPGESDTSINVYTGSAMDAIHSVWDSLSNLVSHSWDVSIGGWGFGGGGGGGAFASGGIRTHADGGIRYHASGGSIVTKATPLDIVGEAGAEAIVPLTNRHYVTPFARSVAEEMSSMMPSSAQATLAQQASMAAAIGKALSGTTASGASQTTVTISAPTKIVAADEDVYVARTISDRALMSTVASYI